MPTMKISSSPRQSRLGKVLQLTVFLLASSSFMVDGLLSTVTYRKARVGDLPGISTLLVDTFEEDTKEGTSSPAWKFWDKQQDSVQNDYIRQLEKRMTLPQHMLIVAVDEKKDNAIAGFMELGTMTSPIAISQKLVIPEGRQLNEGESEEISVRPERPYLANVAVDANYRRQRMGTKLVQLAVKIASKWETESDYKDTAAMYLAVEKDNEAAVCLYDHLGFTRVIDETELPKQVQSKIKRKPRLYYEKKLELNNEQ